MANKKFTDFDLATSLVDGDYIIGYKANATAELRTTFETFRNSLPAEFKYQGADLKTLSANWQSTFTTVQSASATWNEAYTLIQANSATWEADSSEDLEVRALSANWESVYSTVQANSSVEWNYQGTDLKDLSANWEGTFSVVQANSASWGIDEELRSLSASWQDTTTVVQSNSTSWGIDNVIDTDLRDLSANWEGTFATVQSNSATSWDNSLANSYADSKFLPLSGGDLTGAISLSNVQVEQGTTLTDSLSSLVITINGQQYKIPLLAI